MSWDEVEKEIAGKFLKWDESPFRIRFSGEPRVSRKHFINGMPNVCEGDECPHCASGKKLDINFDFTVETHDGEKILTLSRTAMRPLYERRVELGDDKFYTTVFTASRTGTGKKTRYVFDPVAGNDLKPDGDLPF